MRKTVRIIQIIVVAVGLVACVFFIGLDRKTKASENTIVGAVNKAQIVWETDQR